MLEVQDSGIVAGNFNDMTNTMAGQNSFASGEGCRANAECSAAIGAGVVANKPGQVAVGTFNDPDDDAIFSVGCGTSSQNPKTALKVNSDGSVETSGGKVVTKVTTGKVLAKGDTLPLEARLCNALQGGPEQYTTWKGADAVVYDCGTASNGRQWVSLTYDNKVGSSLQTYTTWRDGLAYVSLIDAGAPGVGFRTWANGMVAALGNYPLTASSDEETWLPCGGLYAEGSGFVKPTVNSSGMIRSFTAVTTETDFQFYQKDIGQWFNTASTYATMQPGYIYLRWKEAGATEYTTVAISEQQEAGPGYSLRAPFAIKFDNIVEATDLSTNPLSTLNRVTQTVSGVTTDETVWAPVNANCYSNNSGYSGMEGSFNIVSNNPDGHVEGSNNVIETTGSNGSHNHVEGHGNYLNGGWISHVEGGGNFLTKKSGYGGNASYNHVEGSHNTVTNARNCFVGGNYNKVIPTSDAKVSLDGCHVHGNLLQLGTDDLMPGGQAFGVCNSTDDAFKGQKHLEIVGGGAGTTTGIRRTARILTNTGCEQARGFLPLNQGAGKPTSNTTFIGEMYYDTTNGILYFATGVGAAATYWKPITFGTYPTEE